VRRLFWWQTAWTLSHVFQLSHDLGVTETFLGLRLINLAAVKYWIDEDRLAPTRRGRKLPDAMIALDVNDPLLVLGVPELWPGNGH
jgi:hypothetical protein